MARHRAKPISSGEKPKRFCGEDPMWFANHLRYYRVEAGFSQADLAEKIGVTPLCVKWWEQSRRVPPITATRALCEALRVPSFKLLLQPLPKGNWLEGGADEETEGGS